MSPPLAPIIVVGGHKGGVGRTVVSVNLAAMLALGGHRTLLIDLDPKGEATASVGLPRAAGGKSLERLADPWGLLKDVLTAECTPGLDVWPGGPALEELRTELTQETEPPVDLLDQGLELARQRYRAIVVDGPPDLGPLGCNALGAADVLLLPLSATTFAERALEETIATAFTLRGDVAVFGVQSMTRELRSDGDSEGDSDETDPLRGPLGIELLDCHIAYDAETLLRATEAGVPVFEYDPASRVAHCFLELGREVIQKVLLPAGRLTPSGTFLPPFAGQPPAVESPSLGSSRSERRGGTWGGAAPPRTNLTKGVTMRTRIGCFILASALFPSAALAQDEPKPDDDPRAKAPDEEIDVERPEEIKRIKGELERIVKERKRLRGQDIPKDLGAAVKALRKQQLTPVLTPRKEVIGLRLDEAIQQALANNPDYMIQLLAARAAYEGVPQEEAVFDPILSGSGTYSRGRPPFSQQFTTFAGFGTQLATNTFESFSFTTTLSKSFVTGTNVAVSWRENVSHSEGFSELYTPQLSLQITQPLLRNFGIGVNETGIKVAQNSALSSDATMADTYMGAVLAVEQAYWNLVLTEEQLRAQERSLSSSIKFLDDQRKKLEHGAGTRLEVTIAKAGVASTREAVIIAENSLESARDQIIRLTDPSTDLSKWDRFVVPLDLPLLIQADQQDPAEAVQLALQRRPDYLRALLDIDSARRSLGFAENQVLPQLDLIGTLSEDGQGSTHHSSWTAMTSGRFYTWSMGVQVQLPLILRAERARVRAARHDLERAEAGLRSLEATVILEVRAAIRDVRTSKARIEAARASRILAKERLEATRVQVETGTAVPRDVLDDLAEVARAETNEVQAFINYRLALSRLKQAQGTLLDEWLDELDPRVRAALDRQPYRD